MPSEFTTVFRSAEPSAKEEAFEVRQRLAGAGIDAIVLGDDAPGVIEGTWEVRVRESDRAPAEAILAAPPEVSEDLQQTADASHELDSVTIFSSQGAEGEMEALSVKSLLEASGIPSILVGSVQIPSLPFEVRVPQARADEARALLQEVERAGPAADTEDA